MNKALRVSLLFAFMAMFTVRSLAQDCDHGAIIAAENNYEIGRIYECVKSLKPCANKDGKYGFNYDDKVQAYKLIAESYLAMDSIGQSDKYIEKLLTLNDNFQADANTPPRFNVEVEKIRIGMRANLISSVSKRNENIDLAPATIQIITAEDIENRGYKDVEEILSDVPGFDISRTRGVEYSDIYPRGLRTSSNTAGILLLVDGVEDNDMYSGDIFLSKQYPISNIKRIEIIYGPTSTIYGADAFAGVINIVTKGEDDFFSKDSKAKIAATALAGTGSFNTNYANATIATRTRTTFFSVTGGVYHSDEDDLSSDSAYNGKYIYSDALYRKALTTTANAKNDSTLNAVDPTGKYHTISGNSIIPTSYAIAQAQALDRANYSKTFHGVNPSQFTDPKNDYYVSSKLNIGDLKLEMQYWNRNESASPDYSKEAYALSGKLMNWQVRQGFFSAKYDKKLTERFKLSSSSYYRISNRGDNSGLTTYSSYVNKGLTLINLAGNVSPSFTSTYDAAECDQFRTELSGVYTANDKIDVSGGVEFRDGLIQGNYIKDTIADPLGNSAGTTSYYNAVDVGAYGLVSYNNAANKIKIDLGGREDHDVINGDFGYGSVFNPRVALIYYPKKFIFKAIYSEAFLDPGEADKFTTISSRLEDNPDLKPEKVRNIELSAKYALTKKTNIEVAYYYSSYSSLEVAAPVIYQGKQTTQYQSIGKARIQGVQISGITSISIFSIYANATYTNPYQVLESVLTSADSTTARMGDIANFSANAGVNMKFLKQKFNLNMRINYVGDKPTGTGTTTPGNPNTSTPAYTLLNGTLGYKIRKIGTIQFRVDDILNTTYYSPGVRSASGPNVPIVPQPGMIYYLQFNLNLTK